MIFVSCFFLLICYHYGQQFIIGGNYLKRMLKLKRYLKEFGNFSSNGRSFLGYIILNFISLGAIQVILGLYILELGFAEDFFGLVAGTRMLATGLLAIPAGILIDRVGAKKLLLVSALLAGVSVIIQGLTVNKFVILISSFIYGSAFAILFVMIGPFLSNNSTDQEREELFSVNFLSMTTAKIVGSLLVGFLPALFVKVLMVGEVSKLLSYKFILLTLGILSLMSIIPISYIKEIDSIKINSQDKGFGVIAGMKEEIIGKLSLYQFLIGAGGGLIVPFFSIFLVNKLGASAGQAGVIMFLYQMIRAIALLLTPLLIKKLGKVRSVGVVQATSLPFLLAIVLVPNFAIASVALLLRGALMSISLPITSDFAMEITSTSQHTVTSSLMRTSKSIAKSSSSVVAGWLVSNYGYSLTYFLTFFIYLGGTVLFVKSFLNVESQKLKYST